MTADNQAKMAYNHIKLSAGVPAFSLTSHPYCKCLCRVGPW